MSEIVPVSTDQAVPAAKVVALGVDAPSIEELFAFASEAELRVRSLRMSIIERSWNARGEEVLRHDIVLRHPQLRRPQQARVTTRRTEDPLSSEYDVWIGDGERVRTYSAWGKRASDRARRPIVVGPADPDLPPYSRARKPLTALPAGSIADAFVHPHGLFRNVLVTGPLAIVGTLDVGGREAILVRSEHPRSAQILVDRPDRRVEVGIDRSTGFLLHLSEYIGDSVTHLAEVASLEVDPDIADSTFQLHLGSDVRMIY